jgi:DNA polymerase elongation subunit (family B)
LIKKKKYACVKLNNLEEIKNNYTVAADWKVEVKGLDMIRRDWCNYSRKTGQEILKIILESSSVDDI